MFNGKAILLLLLSVGIGGGAAVYAKTWLQDQQGETIVETANTVNVVVAAREIPYGQLLEDSHLRVVSWPADAAPDGVFADKADIIGKLVNQAALPGDLMLEARVVDKLEGSRLSSLISPNKRAITVRVDDVNGVAGFLLPGNRVDVLATRLIKQRATTRTLLQDIKVLAVDQKASPDKDEPVVVRAVTLEVDLKEAGLLSAATTEGRIQLILRNPEDRAVLVENTPVKQQSKRTVKAADDSLDITIIRGTAVNKSKIKL